MKAVEKKTQMAMNMSIPMNKNIGGQTTPNPIPAIKTRAGKSQETVSLPKSTSSGANAQTDAYAKAMNKAYNNPKTKFY